MIKLVIWGILLFLLLPPSLPPSLPILLTRSITQLLEDLVFFVIDKESLGSGDPLTEEGKPNRDRQKLLREQDVLKNVREIQWWGKWDSLEVLWVEGSPFLHSWPPHFLTSSFITARFLIHNLLTLSFFHSLIFISHILPPHPLLQIFRILSIPLPWLVKKKGKPLFEMANLRDKRHEPLKHLFQLCYRVIQHSQYDYRKNQVRYEYECECVILFLATYTLYLHIQTNSCEQSMSSLCVRCLYELMQCTYSVHVLVLVFVSVYSLYIIL